jgi:CRISPR-associated endonuclease/helicase Cas3
MTAGNKNAVRPRDPDWRQLWAKSGQDGKGGRWHPLWKHLLDASAISLALPNCLSVFGWSEARTALIVGLHDIGKADAVFQHQVPELSERLQRAGFPVTADARCRHERLSARFIRDELRNAGMSERDIDTVGRTVVAHHGYWVESDRDVPSPYKEAQEELFKLLKAVLGDGQLPDAVLENHSAFGMRLSGRIVLCDWIASNEKFFADKRLAGLEDPGVYLAKAKEVAREWIERLELARDNDVGKAALVVETPRPIQEALLNNDIPPGLVIIEAPMGEGKTEAAWILAERWREQGYQGMYMALPTMATSDSLYTRYCEHYLNKLGRGGSAKLVHGMAWLRDEKEPEKLPETGEPGDDQDLAAAWFRPARRAMLAAHGVGTVDQAMLAGMHVKFGFLRLYGLADRVLVIDEVHAYDAYMSAIIARLLQWCSCLKIPVILLSATLSAKQRTAMIEAYGATGGDPGPGAPYPLITAAEPMEAAQTIPAGVSSKRTLKIEVLPGLLGHAKKTAKLTQELVKNGGCCCVILNTVKQAQAVFRELKLPEDEKLLFHARFTAADRECITNRVLDLFGKDTANRPERLVLVATQVVEQSLDVDFDYMISEIAPIDLLLQRSGRIKRHSRDAHGGLVDGPDQRGAPVLHVLLPEEKKDKKGEAKPLDFGASEKIYQRYSLLRTLDALKDKGVVKLPDEFRPLIETVYGDALPADANDDLKAAEQAWNDLQEDLAAQAGEFLLCEPMADEFDPVGADEVGDDSDDGNGWRARTRLGLQEVLAIPVTNGDAKELAKGSLSREEIREFYQQSLKIPARYWPLRPQPSLNEQERKESTPFLGEGKLRGAWLLPVRGQTEQWSWTGERRIENKGKVEWKPITFCYSRDMGLLEDENDQKSKKVKKQEDTKK